MLCYEGKLSLYCFLGTSSFILLLSIPPIYFEFLPNIVGAIVWGPIFYYALINMILRFGLKGEEYQVAIRATFLGFIFSGSILTAIYAPTRWKPFGIYGSYMAFFHYSEYLGIAWSNPKTLSINAFLLYHSPQYVIAAISSWIEFIIEVLLYPEIKEYMSLWTLGIILCTFGESLRKIAMITIKNNFSHLVIHAKEQDHCLVTHGVYGLMRHPSYVGWFWWAIGTQIILANPICIVAYTLAGWKFFKDRIYFEELTLINFFGKEYYDYQQRVPIHLPFIKGYQLPKGLVEFLK